MTPRDFSNHQKFKRRDKKVKVLWELYMPAAAMALHSTMKTLGADNGANLNHSQSSSYKGFSRVVHPRSHQDFMNEVKLATDSLPSTFSRTSRATANLRSDLASHATLATHARAPSQGAPVIERAAEGRASVGGVQNSPRHPLCTAHARQRNLTRSACGRNERKAAGGLVKAGKSKSNQSDREMGR